MRFDFFFFAETNRRSWPEQVARGARSMTLRLPEGTGLTEAIAAAREAGMPKGSARSGCFEVQTDLGIWSRADGRGWGRLTEKNARFQSWALIAA